MLERQLLVRGTIGVIVLFGGEVVLVEKIQETQLRASGLLFHAVFIEVLPQLPQTSQLTTVELGQYAQQ